MTQSLDISIRPTCFLSLFLLVSNQTSFRLNNARYTSFYIFIYVYIVTRLRSIYGVHKYILEFEKHDRQSKISVPIYSN